MRASVFDGKRGASATNTHQDVYRARSADGSCEAGCSYSGSSWMGSVHLRCIRPRCTSTKLTCTRCAATCTLSCPMHIRADVVTVQGHVTVGSGRSRWCWTPGPEKPSFSRSGPTCRVGPLRGPSRARWLALLIDGYFGRENLIGCWFFDVFRPVGTKTTKINRLSSSRTGRPKPGQREGLGQTPHRMTGDIRRGPVGGRKRPPGVVFRGFPVLQPAPETPDDLALRAETVKNDVFDPPGQEPVPGPVRGDDSSLPGKPTRDVGWTASGSAGIPTHPRSGARSGRNPVGSGRNVHRIVRWTRPTAVG